MLVLMMLKELALEMVVTVLDLAGLILMPVMSVLMLKEIDLAGLILKTVMSASTLKEVVLEMTVLDLAGLTLMHLRVMVAEILAIFWIEVVVVCL